MKKLFYGSKSNGDTRIDNLWKWLLARKAEGYTEILMRTTYAGTGWHDVEFDANSAGYNVYRVVSPELEARHEFAKCYKFVLK